MICWEQIIIVIFLAVASQISSVKETCVKLKPTFSDCIRRDLQDSLTTVASSTYHIHMLEPCLYHIDGIEQSSVSHKIMGSIPQIRQQENN